MIKDKKLIVSLLVAFYITIFLIFVSVPSKAYSSEWVQVVKLYLQEYVLPAREGTLIIYYNIDSRRTAAVMNIGQICTSNIFMAGGVAAGWIDELGANSSNTINTLTSINIISNNSWVDNDMMLLISDYVYYLWSNMGPRNYSFAFAVNYGRSLNDNSFGDNYMCGNTVVNEEGNFAALFQNPLPQSLPSENWVGDFVVFGEATGGREEWYGIYINDP
jgi:hypothetical protein